MPVRNGPPQQFSIHYLSSGHALDPSDCRLGGTDGLVTPLTRHTSSMSGTRMRKSAFSMAGSLSLCRMIFLWPSPCIQSLKRSKACSEVPLASGVANTQSVLEHTAVRKTILCLRKQRGEK
eukprot:4006797-Amphidinium_carterae.1